MKTRINLTWTAALFLFATLVTTNAWAQADKKENYSFFHITPDDGLSHSAVNDILKDHQGYMWFATENGLNKYEGNNMISYFQNPKDSNSISDNAVQCLYEDHNKKLWIGTRSNGIDIFDQSKSTFRHIAFSPNNSKSILSNSINIICEDDEGNIWVGSSGGLSKYDQNGRHIANYQHESKDSLSLSHNDVTSVYVDYNGNIWVGTNGGGLNKFDSKTGSFISYQHDENDDKSLSNNIVRAIVGDAMGVIYVGSFGGVDILNSNHTKFTNYNTNSAIDDNLDSDRVWALALDHEGDLWVGTDRGGLNVLRKGTSHFIQYKNEPNNNKSINDDVVRRLYKDDANYIWIGTYRGGVNFFEKKESAFEHINVSTDAATNISSSSIMAISQMGDDDFWIGTDGAGFFRYSRIDGVTNKYQHNNRDVESLSSDAVLAIYKDHEGDVWLGTYDGGLNLFNPDTESFTHYRANSDDPKSISSDEVWGITEDSQNFLWLATGNGLNRLDKKTGAFIHYYSNPDDPLSLMSNNVKSIYEDSKGRLWICTIGGLHLYQRESDDFKAYVHDENDPQSISNNGVLNIMEDSNGQLWVCTNGGGVNRFDPDSGTFISYWVADGLPDDVIFSVIEDDNHKFWMSTNKGLSRYDPEEKSFNNYYSNDGLQQQQFNSGAYLKVENTGEMMFGGINGFNIFDPKKISLNDRIPPIVITDFLIFNQSAYNQNGLSTIENFYNSKSIKLDHEQSIFTIRFAALNYAHPEKNLYAFKLEGYDKVWRYVRNQHSTTYTNLDPGHYLFKVKGSNNDGIWNEKGTSLSIEVTPPWWELWWVKMLGILTVFTSIYLIYIIRINAINKQKLLLEIQVSNRTAELTNSNKQIMLQSEQINTNYQEMKDLNQFKEGLTSMIVHDLKNPLNTILGNAEKKIVQQAASQMLNMVSNILDVNKFENSEIEVDAHYYSLQKIVNEALNQVQMLLEQKALRVETSVGEYHLNVDLSLITRLFVNLLTNAIKYSPANGLISIEATSDLIDNDYKIHEQQDVFDQILIIVSDQGQGIPKAKQEKIFEKFVQVEAKKLGNVRSTGLGLTFCKMAVEAHKGVIGVTSTLDEGSQFWMTLPRGRKGVAQETIEEMNVNKDIELTISEIAILKAFVPKFDVLTVYEYGDLKKILKQIPASKDSQLHEWKRKLETAILGCNEIQYQRLLNMINQ